MLYTLASELLRLEPIPFAVHLQKVALYKMMPWKRRLDNSVKYLESTMTTVDSDPTNIHLLEKAAAQKCKSMMPEILAKRAIKHMSAGR